MCALRGLLEFRAVCLGWLHMVHRFDLARLCWLGVGVVRKAMEQVSPWGIDGTRLALPVVQVLYI